MLGTIPTTARRSFFSATCDLYSHTVERHLFRPCYKAHTSPSSKLEDYVGTMHLPVHLVFVYTTIGFLTSVEILFSTLAPRACITYYQARGLSGHTSPCGECVCFSTTMPLMIKDATLQDALTFLFRNTSGHTSQDGNLFLFFLRAPYILWTTYFSGDDGGRKMSRTRA